MPSSKRRLSLLIESNRGQAWIGQFSTNDRLTAQRLIGCLTLVSHSAYERALAKLIENEAASSCWPIALYATREADPNTSFFDINNPIDAVGRGNDIGSEARVAALIRNLARANPSKYLNHPTLQEMKDVRCRSIYVLDDIIGSGKRTYEFLSSMWHCSTIRSWHSFGWIDFKALAYAATDFGINKLHTSKTNPKISTFSDCPTINDMPWTDNVKSDVMQLCRLYGKKTSKKGMALGFKSTAATIIFEHGAPNNSPAILWAPQKTTTWVPLFPDRSVLPSEASAFPHELQKRDLGEIFNDLGDHKVAASMGVPHKNLLSPTVLAILALLRADKKSRALISYATGLPKLECSSILTWCVEQKLITRTLSLTPLGRAELASAGRAAAWKKTIPIRGDDGYYPQQLRRPVGS